MKLDKDRVNTDELKFIFANRMIEHWNKLPGKVISVNSSNPSKINLDKYLRANEGNL